MKLTEDSHTGESTSYATSTYSIRQVLIVDDSSSRADKLTMLSATQHCIACTVVFKGQPEKGHAESMNMIIKLALSRYLLYIEDDWLPLPKPLVQRSFLQPLLQLTGTPHGEAAVSLRDFVAVAISILKKQGHATCFDFECLEDRSIVQVSLYFSVMFVYLHYFPLSLIFKLCDVRFCFFLHVGALKRSDISHMCSIRNGRCLHQAVGAE